jgi:hypothetical protein
MAGALPAVALGDGGLDVGITNGIDLGDIWSHYCTLNEHGGVVDRGRFQVSKNNVFSKVP